MSNDILPQKSSSLSLKDVMTQYWYDYFSRRDLERVRTGTVSLTLTGVTTLVKKDFTFKLIGEDLCILTPPVSGALGVSNSNACTLTGLPAMLSPNIDALGPMLLINASNSFFGLWYIAAGSTVIRLDIESVTGALITNLPNGFTAAGGNKGVPNWAHIIYRVKR